MRTNESKPFVEELYSEICEAIMPDDQSGDAPPSTQFVSLTIPGTVVDASDFDRSASQNRGYLLAHKDLLSLANKEYGGSTRHCDGMYAQMVSAIQPADDPDGASDKDAACDEAPNE